MRNKKNTRTCIVCRQKRDKNTLVRLVLCLEDKKILVDKHNKIPGRGAYICSDNIECLLKGMEVKRLNKAFKNEVKHEYCEIIRRELGKD